jgi:hypothetical protein
VPDQTWTVEPGKRYPVDHTTPDLSKERRNPGFDFYGVTAAGACGTHGVYTGTTCPVCAYEKEAEIGVRL